MDMKAQQQFTAFATNFVNQIMRVAHQILKIPVV